MTKRQRVIAQEESPISTPITPPEKESEAIIMAQKRIAELQLFIELRRKAK